MHFDLPLAELATYRPDVEEAGDFDAFWAGRLAEADAAALDVSAERIDSVITNAEVFDVHFTGHGGTRVAAWLLVPNGVADDAPVVVEFIGYGGGRGRPIDWLRWSAAGSLHLVIDTRGQGGDWRQSDTPDPGDGGEPGARGFLARGLLTPEGHYYSRLYVDAARAMRVPGEIDVLAGRRVFVAGASQGGALALAAASLSGSASAVMPEVPFLAHFRRAASITDAFPYSEIAAYCKVHADRVDTVFHTLSYFDVVNHAKRITAPGMFSVGLVDNVTPPSTVYAAYNHYAGEKQIEVYEFNGHEGGGSLHFERQVRWAGTLGH